jgi:hypothetical protein
VFGGADCVNQCQRKSALICVEENIRSGGLFQFQGFFQAILAAPWSIFIIFEADKKRNIRRKMGIFRAVLKFYENILFLSFTNIPESG